MSVNVGEFRWSARSERAALLVAQDELTDRKIATACSMSDRTLDRWKQHPEFAARVQEHRDAWREEIKAKGIASRQNRVDAQNDRWRRMQQVIDERAADESMSHVPGGSTGLLAHNVKGVGRGEDFQLIDIYEVDTGLLKELREHEKLTAEELGQRKQMVAVEVEKELEQALDRLAAQLSPEEYARVIAALADPEAS